jgi:hypothetical protein
MQDSAEYCSDSEQTSRNAEANADVDFDLPHFSSPVDPNITTKERIGNNKCCVILVEVAKILFFHQPGSAK